MPCPESAGGSGTGLALKDPRRQAHVWHRRGESGQRRVDKSLAHLGYGTCFDEVYSGKDNEQYTSHRESDGASL